MPRVMAMEDTRSCSLDECIAGLDELQFDPRDEGKLTEAVCWLRRACPRPRCAWTPSSQAMPMPGNG